MVRINVFITEKQDDKLQDKSTDLGISKSELLRRILDEWISSLARESEQAANEEEK